MDKENYTITDKKTIEELVQELQYLNSDILPKLEKGSDLNINVSNIDIKTKDAYKEIVKLSKQLNMLYNNVEHTVENIAKKIDATPIERKLMKIINTDSDRLNVVIRNLHTDLVIALRDAMMTVQDFEEHKRSVDSLKKELMYMKYINVFLFIGVGLLIYKI